MKSKKILLYLLAIVLSSILCACGSGKAPSETLIKSDMETALSNKYKNIVLDEIETIKSLSEEDIYTSTIMLKSHTNYAYVNCEVDILYTKYDQGWILDRIDWMQETYSINKIASDSEMIEIVNNSEYLLFEHEELLPIETGVVSEYENGNYEFLIFEFNNTQMYKHAEKNTEYKSLWKYNVYEDIWEFCEYDSRNEFAGEISLYEPFVSFVGEWKGDYGDFNIIKYSAEEVHASGSWSNGEVKIFKASDNPYSSGQIEENTNYRNSCYQWYVSEDGYKIVFTFQENQTNINVYKGSLSNMYVWFVEIKEDIK